MPSGHDGARQPLAELRRILDAEWQRIRGKLIPANERFNRDDARADHLQRLADGIHEDLMARALAIVRIIRNALHRGGFGLLRLLSTGACTAQLKCLRRVSRQNEQAYKESK